MRRLEIKTANGFKVDVPSLDYETFDRLRHRITSSSGLFIPPDENSRFIIERRLMPRLRVRGSQSFPDYLDTLDEGELALPVNA